LLGVGIAVQRLENKVNAKSATRNLAKPLIRVMVLMAGRISKDEGKRSEEEQDNNEEVECSRESRESRYTRM